MIFSLVSHDSYKSRLFQKLRTVLLYTLVLRILCINNLDQPHHVNNYNQPNPDYQVLHISKQLLIIFFFLFSVLKQNYPHNTFRSIIESMVKSANSKWEFMVKLAKAIKNKSSQFPKYVEFLKNFMADATFVF